MLYYPIDPNGGGAEQRLIGVARIRRVTDTYFSANAYRKLFKNCEFVNQLGDTGSLDSSTGILTKPDVCKLVKVTISPRTSGHGNRVFSRISSTSTEQVEENGVDLRNYDDPSVYEATHHLDIESDDEFWINIYFQTSSYTIESGNPLNQDEAIVEFYA
jgi:hypothetical protein